MWSSNINCWAGDTSASFLTHREGGGQTTARGSSFLLGTLPSAPRAQRTVRLVFLHLAFLHETSASLKPSQPAPYLVPAGKVWFGTAARGETIAKPRQVLVRFTPSFFSILCRRRRERCLHQPHAATDVGDSPCRPSLCSSHKKGLSHADCS